MPSIVYTIIIIIALLFFGVLVWYVATRNSIKRAEQAVNESEAALEPTPKRHLMPQCPHGMTRLRALPKRYVHIPTRNFRYL
ncbi:unknown [Ruminococcus sp. CAG:382]|nr:unknown [Ruminococcus sp. CAG:382]